MMDDKDLEALWQQQSTQVPKLSELKRKWNKTKYQQWLFFCIDMLACIFTAFICIKYWDKFNWLSASVLAGVLVFSLGYTGYVTWLRRVAAKTVANTTQGYMQSMRQQLRNNIQIAQTTINIIIPMVLFMNVFWLSHVLVDQTEFMAAMRKFLIMNGLFILIYTPMYFWFKRRQRKCVEELERLKSLEA